MIKTKQQVLTEYSAADIIAQLSPFVTQNRQAKIKQVVAARLQSLQVAMDCPRDPRNISAVLRSAEALGVYHCHVINPNPRYYLSRGVTQGAYNWLDITQHTDFSRYIQYQQTNNIKIAAACFSAEYSLRELPIDEPLCLLFGREKDGLTEDVINQADYRFTIPMYGMSQSFNLSVSAAITMQHLAYRFREQLNNSADFDEAGQENLIANYYLQSVRPRLIENLFKG